MSLESSVRECGVGLCSNRATERKKNAENLKEFLLRNAVPSLLSENTNKSHGYSWNEVFDDINEYILKETEKFETSKTFDNVIRPLCASLLQLCIAGASKGQAYIKCDKIIDACLFVLKDKRLSKAMGDEYLQIMYKYVLNNEHYIQYITPTAWEELLELSLNIHLSKTSKIDNLTKMRLIWLIVKNGTNCCQLSIPLRDLLPKFRKCFTDVNDNKIQEFAVEVIILLIEVLCVECRKTMCEFTESILSSILNLYDQSVDARKKASFFKMLQMVVALHHPQGKKQNDEGSLACNWNIWNKQLRSILEIVCLEVTFLQKNRKINESSPKHCDNLNNLAALVYYQIFDLHMDVDDNGSNSKRQRTDFNKNKCFSDIIEEIRHNHMPWLAIAHIFVQNYGGHVSEGDYLSLLSVIEHLVTSNPTCINLDILGDTACLAIQNLTYHAKLEEQPVSILQNLWNSCVRTSTLVNCGHKALHKIMQLLLDRDILKYQDVQPLIKLYLEKGMPVTNYSIETLSHLFHSFFSKFNSIGKRNKCFSWLIQSPLYVLNVKHVKELLFRLLANEKSNFVPQIDVTKSDDLHDILFKSINKRILFSEFVLAIPNSIITLKQEVVTADIIVDVNREVQDYFEKNLTMCYDKLRKQEIDLLDYTNFIKIVVAYLDVMLNNNLMSSDQIKHVQIYKLVQMALKCLFSTLTRNLKNKDYDESKMNNLFEIIQDILVTEYHPDLCLEVRKCINEEFFHSVNSVLNTEKFTEDREASYKEDQTEIDPNSSKHICICLLAAYCRKNVPYREEILDLILDYKMYNFTCPFDFDCAIKCIEQLNNSFVEEVPLELILPLLQNMCKDCFRNSKASIKILDVLVKMLEQVWEHKSNMKQNCLIMVKSYLRRCNKSYYPPSVAALVYECASKITAMNLKLKRDPEFLLELMGKTKGNIHIIRVFCCYMLKHIIVYLSDNDIEEYLVQLLDLFVIQVSERRETILKDEAQARTLSVLHGYYALAQVKPSALHTIVTELMQIQKDKSLDKLLVKKVLNKITILIVTNDLQTYLNENILWVLNQWFSKGNKLEDLPLTFFGIEDMDAFIEVHKKWLIPTEILWNKNGVINHSDVLNRIREKSGINAQNIIEACISNILLLCLPYHVTDKYNLSYTAPGKWEWMAHADKMILMTKEMLGADKWSSLLVENMGELLIVTATCLSDHAAANRKFQVDVPRLNRSYCYPKEVFDAILQFISELIEEDVMKYLCQNQPFAIFKTLFKLWEHYLDEKIFQFKVLALYTFISFYETVPMGYNSDAFICNFACNGLAHAVKNSSNKDEINVLLKALKSILERILLKRIKDVRKSTYNLLSILIIKKEEGLIDECMINYLVTLKENEDVVDFIGSTSQPAFENDNCSTMQDFLEKSYIYANSLSCPSHDTLKKLRKFLKSNKQYVHKLSDELNTKGFSDDCGTSVIHQHVYALSEIMKTATDEKTKIEACNCIAVIGNYDLKTLVMFPPGDKGRIISVLPRHYFAMAVMDSLSEILFDEKPAVTNGATKILKKLCNYREGKLALDLSENNKILLPFLTESPRTYADFKINDIKFNSLCVTEHWVRKRSENHSQWLIRVTAGLLDVLATSSNYLNLLRAVCVMKASLCKTLLPPLVGLLLDAANARQIKIFGEKVNQFVKHIWHINFDANENSEDSNTATRVSSLDQEYKNIIQSMLEIVNFVRLQKHHYSARQDRGARNLNFFSLDYEKVAWAASVADQNLASIFYGELWAAEQNDGVPPSSPEATSQLDGGDNVQRIFRKCFVAIGELDAIDGCGTAHLTSENEKRRHLINTGQFTDSLLLHDIALSSGGQMDPRLQYGVVKSLHKSGMHHLALQYIKSLPENDDLNDLKYECLSFLGDWSDFVSPSDLKKKRPYSIIKAFRYSCLKDCLNLKTTAGFEAKLEAPLNRAKLAVAKLTQNLNMENCQNVYKVISKLQLFEDIEHYFSVRCGETSIQELTRSWQTENLPAFHDFKNLEALISQRSLVLDHAAKLNPDCLKDIVSLQLKYAEMCLSNHRVQMAQRMLAVAKKLQTSPEIDLVESRISWATGHKDIALSMLRNIVANPTPDVTHTAMSLRQYGLWMAETKCDNARNIINKYLKKSLDVLNEKDHPETRLMVYYDIAKFADAEYTQVVTYMNSSVFEKKVKVVEDMINLASIMQSPITQQALSKDEKKALAANTKFGQIDEAEIASTKAEKESFLHLAMRYYLLSLKEGEANNLSVFRLISLWLDNPSLQLADSADGSFEKLLHAIPSRKFITVLPQLAPRLTNESSNFANNLRKLIKRCAIDHPHHTLPILFNIKNSEKDKQILNASKNVATPRSQSRKSQDPRASAADAIVGQLSRDTGLAVIIAQMEKICDAIISFANYVPKTKEQKQQIPAEERIHRLGHLDAIPIPTDSIPISHACNYFDIPTLFSIGNTLELVGGINCPKKITGQCSNGLKKILLIKGEDDLRQDSVMQQVFQIVNTLLENDPVTSRNKLLIRTYKVVPMSRKSGVLEWCEGTMPIGSFLVDENGAHARYRPQDISTRSARAQLGKLAELRRSKKEKLAVFLKILKEFKPAFHYFFTEHYLDPVTWYERRLAYTKSVAASSMVGYILGLGDRHLQNILIDKRTAEVVHIDFGIAFDQGKTLPTPETIPFRLTQDIVAGFGSCGVEGIFRKCCEKTMQLLRDNQGTLLTILEVLLCDPLYSWTVTSKQQNVLTVPSKDTTINQISGSDGSLAKRALLTVSSKLSGTEGGVAAGVAVPGQVARLINTAMDPANLSCLFHGWQPYL